jgi:hypothetical protein
VSDERPRGNGAPGEDDQAQEPHAHESDELTSGAGAESEPEFGQTIPIVSRRLPSAQSFFGEPRPPRHSAHVDPPASAPEGDTTARDDAGAPLDGGPVGLPTEEPVSEEPGGADPAETAPAPEPDRPALDVPPPPDQRVTSTAPHPMALDLSVLQGGENLIAPPSASAESGETPAPQPWHLGDDAPVLDPGALPAHDGDGETPTAAFGAVFGATPPAPAPVTPAPGSFTELISVPDDAPLPSAQPTSFNWSDLPEPRTAEIAVAPTPARLEPEPEVDEEGSATPEAGGAAPEWKVHDEPPLTPASADIDAQEPGLPPAAEPAPEVAPPPAAADSAETPRTPTFTELLGAIPHDEPSGADEQRSDAHADAADAGISDAGFGDASEAAAAKDAWHEPRVDPAPTQAMPTVRSLSDDEPGSSMPAPTSASPDSSEASSNSQPESGLTAPTSSAAIEPEPSNPPTDPFVALFGADLVEEADGSESITAAEVVPTAPADSGGSDGAWADEFREPIPPALIDGDSGVGDSGAAEDDDRREVGTAASAEAAGPSPSSGPTSDPDLDGAPTVAYRPPFDTSGNPTDTPTVAYHPSADDDESAPRFAPPAVYRGPSSRAVTPIDAANVPASWAAAAPAYGQTPHASEAGAASAAAPAWQPAAGGEQGAGGAGGTRGGGGFATWPRERRLLLFIGIVAVFVVVLAILLFLVGRALASPGAAPAAVPSQAVTKSASPTPTPSAPRTPTPTPTAPTAAGPAAPGTHQWTDLTGGECLSSFTNAWQQTYQVVDCGTGHPAQMVAKGTVTDTTYPGATALAAQVAPLCQSNTVIDFSKAASYTDIQVSASYPATQSQWDAGDHSYYCFVSRSSGQAITGSLRAGS